MKKEIKVAGIVYKVKEEPFIEINGNRNYQGCCDFPNTEISILADISDERKERVIVHELTHAIFYEAGYEEQDEDMVNRIGNVLHQVLKDNENILDKPLYSYWEPPHHPNIRPCHIEPIFD